MTDEELTRRFDGIDENFKGIDEKFKGIDEKFTGIDQQLLTLATKSDVKEEGVATRRHFDIVAEKMQADIALIAEERLDVRQLALETRQTKLEEPQ